MKLPPSSDPDYPRCVASCNYNGLRFEQIHCAVGYRIPTHSHDVAFLDLCVEGTIQEFWGKRTFQRGPATLNFLPIGAPHSNYCEQGTKTFQIVLPSTWIERVAQGVPLVNTLTSYPNGLPTLIALRLYREFQRRDNLSPLIMEGMLLELFGEMARDTPNRMENACPRWLRQTRDYLHAHFTESLAMETVAAAVGVHPAHLMRGFRQQHRCTIGDYIRRLRVEYACHLLCTSDDSASQIALKVGFADQSHFNRTFKSEMGMTPTEFQKVSGLATQRQELIR